MQRRQAEKFEARDQAIVANRAQGFYQGEQAAVAQYHAPPPQYQAPPPPPAAAPETDVISQLKELGALRTQGILTEEEFAAQKAKILGS